MSYESMSAFRKLGDKLKRHEDVQQSQVRLTHELPIYARLDGKRFSKFTADLAEPFDDAFRSMMVNVTKTLVQKTGADFGYTQSDEISLYWKPRTVNSDQIDFNGRIEKWIGELVGLATASFMAETLKVFPDKMNMLPRFDCRVFNTTDELAKQFFVWRQMDAKKNSINQVCYTYYSAKSLLNVSQEKRLSMLRKDNLSWENFGLDIRYGIYVKRFPENVKTDTMNIPEKVRDSVPEYVVRNIIAPFECYEFHEKDSHTFDTLEDLLINRFHKRL